MNRHILRIFIFAFAILTICGHALPTHAGGSAWSWTDISEKVAERQNRPIWAIARGEPYWYFTDGQELYSGGHVWRTDGTYLADITLEIRNAGLTRVDDIVSNGQSVLFLKNIANRYAGLEAISYHPNQGYLSLTLALRNAAPTGINRIAGSSNGWIVATNLGHLYRIDTSKTTKLTTPAPVSSLNDYAYSIRHASPADGYSYIPLAAEPIGQDLLVASRDQGGTTLNFWKYGASNNPQILTSLFGGMKRIHAISSNGSTVLVAGSTNNDNITNRVYTYDGVTVRDMSSTAALIPLSNWNRVRIGWNGVSWMILNDKDLFRFQGNSFASLGKTTDLFVSLSGNLNGTFLLGGAESTDWLGANPSSPLTATLVKVTENNIGQNGTSNPTYGGGRTVTSSYGPTITTSGNPSNFRVGNGGTFVYHVAATDPNGVDHIDLYANGVRIKTCYADACEFSAQYFTNGLATRSIPFFAKAVDRSGYTTDGTNSIDTLTVDLVSTATANGNSNTGTSNDTNGISSWTRTEPQQSTLRRDQSMTFYVGSWSAVGVKRVDIVVNGGTRQVCDYGTALGNQTCSVLLYGSDYALNTQVAFNAKITDTNNKVVWTPLNTITIVDANGTITGSGTQNTDLSSWAWSAPEVSSLKPGENTVFNVSAYDPQGVTRIEMWVNGVVQNSCSFSGTATNRECAATIYANNYKLNTDVFVNAKITDATGAVGWSSSRLYRITNSGGSNTSTGSTSVISVTSTPNRLTLLQGDVQTFTVSATDPEGVRRMNIWLNGVNVASCDTGSVTYSTKTCSTTINANSYTPNTNVFANAEIIDGQGNVTWSSGVTYYIQSSTTVTNTTSADVPGWITVTSDKDQGFKTNDKITVTANAGDGNGIARIDILLNGAVNKACVNTSVCTYVAGPYPTRSSVSYAARVVDQKGYTVWTSYKTIYKK